MTGGANERLLRLGRLIDNLQAPPWTREELLLLANFRERGWSMARIGKALGRSRNAVAGRLYREYARVPNCCPTCGRPGYKGPNRHG